MRAKMPDCLDIDEIINAAQRDDNTGFCISCGGDVDGVEPDARSYNCPHCSRQSVYGAEQLILMYC